MMRAAARSVSSLPYGLKPTDPPTISAATIPLLDVAAVMTRCATP
jgi:hypothetical protein